jgi:hypothetical protein
MSLIFVDCESKGPCPVIGVLTEFGAIEYESRKSFYGDLQDRDDIVKKEIFEQFTVWLKQFKGSPSFVSDNPAFDWQWINYEFHRLLGFNPFGHSARRISDFYAGLRGDFHKTQQWKRLRITKHDHNPVHDALGNVEAFERLLKGER